MQKDNLINKLKVICNSLSPFQIFLSIISIITGTILIFLYILYKIHDKLIILPAYGGELYEYINEDVKIINPLFSTNDTEKRLSSLLYVGLKCYLYDNKLNNCLAQSIDISDDKLTYNVKLKPNLKWSNGEAITTKDIAFTVDKIQSGYLMNDYGIQWEGVTYDIIDDMNIVFHLKKPYTLFDQALSVGILPHTVWENVKEQEFYLHRNNLSPITSGPFKISNMTIENGITYIELIRNKNYYDNLPYISKYIYTNDAKYLSKNYNAISFNKTAPENYDSFTYNSDKYDALAFNPNNLKYLANVDFRLALTYAINKEEIRKLVGEKDHINIYGFTNNATNTYNMDIAMSHLEDFKNKEKIVNLSDITVTLSYLNSKDYKLIATAVQKDWSKLGINVILKGYDINEVNENILKERDFQALIYGFKLKNPEELYSFWHSSQRKYPGLNITNYVSQNLDDNLTKLRTEFDAESKTTALNQIDQELNAEAPQIILLRSVSQILYNKNIKGINYNNNYNENMPYTNITNWHIYEDKVIFEPNYKLLNNLSKLLY